MHLDGDERLKILVFPAVSIPFLSSTVLHVLLLRVHPVSSLGGDIFKKSKNVLLAKGNIKTQKREKNNPW